MSQVNVNNCECHSTIASENSSICGIDSEVKNIPKQLTNRSIFVTVGTTSFDQLIEVFNTEELQNVLYKLGYRKITFQIGRGLVVPRSCSELIFDYFTFKSGLHEELTKAGLVVSHAGAGTCLEACQAPVRLVVVINDMLMHNHQSELAEKLAQLGHCKYATCSTLVSLFRSLAPCLGAGVAFQDVFTRFDTDYYRNVAREIEDMF